MNRLAISCVAAAASAGLAQALADPPARNTREEGDTGQIVCKSDTEPGSRLRRRRVCRTRAEWAELQAQSFKPVICNPDAQGGWRC